MVLSSVVVQMFSWFWFKYDRELPGFGAQTGAGAVLFGDQVKLSCVLHVLQLGFLCRHISAIRQGFKVWWRKEEGSEYAIYLTHDLSMLRLIETFCESAPQLTLMIYVMLHTNKARTVQFVSIAASTTSIAWMVVDYHRSLRSFLPDKAKQGWGSSFIYFLWNLLLIAPRVAALALFASVLPRHAGVLEMSLRTFFTKCHDPEGFAVFLSHDLSLLRLVETFSESTPQLVLMLTIILQRHQLDPVTVSKAVGSFSAVAFSVTTYHRSLRSFLPDKENQQITSSVVYFFSYLFLISSRVTALALFASVLPCFIFTHFFCSWLVLVFFAWRSKGDFMESPGGEWLYRATVGLIWYFAWFNVVKGRTRYKLLLYHLYMLADISIVCGYWCWKMCTEPSYFEIPHLYAIIASVSIVAVYILGLLFKIMYYKFCHPNLGKNQLKEVKTNMSQTGVGLTTSKSVSGDEVDLAVIMSGVSEATYDFVPQINILREQSDTDVTDGSWPSPPAPGIQRCNKRMRKLAENFYS
ncbi:XK-related protein 8-like isoform X2 [Xiphias gladius]|nr:XK-related protein 8-like isoform X2 [Xiphias gladius]